MAAGGGRGRPASIWDALFGRKGGEDAPARGGFRRLFSKCPDAMALLEGDSVLETNSAWDRLFGRDEDESVGRPLSEFMPEAASGDEAFPIREFTGLKADGARLSLEDYRAFREAYDRGEFAEPEQKEEQAEAA